MSDQNMFGGKNPLGLYVPMSETEQEVLLRLSEEKSLRIEVEGWGFIENPKMIFGDKRVSFPIDITFNAPDVSIPLHTLTLSLWRGTLLLFRETYPTLVDYQPLYVGAGVTVSFAWDIALHSMNPAFVKEVKPKEVGLTSREGNRHLQEKERIIYEHLRTQEQTLKRDHQRNVGKAEHLELSILPAPHRP